MASRRPVTAAIFPAGISSTSTLSAPIIMPVCWMRLVLATPETYSSIPRCSVPENSLPVATSPAWGSILTLLIMKATGPLGSQVAMAFPTGLLQSPCQMTLTLSFWASMGLGRNLTTISFTAR